jgi:hypothetical protein
MRHSGWIGRPTWRSTRTGNDVAGSLLPAISRPVLFGRAHQVPAPGDELADRGGLTDSRGPPPTRSTGPAIAPVENRAARSSVPPSRRRVMPRVARTPSACLRQRRHDRGLRRPITKLIVVYLSSVAAARWRPRGDGIHRDRARVPSVSEVGAMPQTARVFGLADGTRFEWADRRIERPVELRAPREHDDGVVPREAALRPPRPCCLSATVSTPSSSG